MAEVLPGGQHSAQENSCINGRDFRSAMPATCLDVDEVIVKAVYLFGVIQQEIERLDDSGMNFFGRKIKPMVTDTESGESEAGRGNARHTPRICAAIGQGAITNQTGAR